MRLLDRADPERIYSLPIGMDNYTRTIWARDA